MLFCTIRDYFHTMVLKNFVTNCYFMSFQVAVSPLSTSSITSSSTRPPLHQCSNPLPPPPPLSRPAPSWPPPRLSRSRSTPPPLPPPTTTSPPPAGSVRPSSPPRSPTSWCQRPLPPQRRRQSLRRRLQEEERPTRLFRTVPVSHCLRQTFTFTI